MINDNELRSIIEKVVAQSHDTKPSSVPTFTPQKSKKEDQAIEYKLHNLNHKSQHLSSDIGMVDLKEQIFVDNPDHPDELARLRRHTPARIAVGRSGTRYKTETILRFRADHATAQDAVFTDVSEELLQKLNLKSIITKCKDRNEFITRPDLGRQFAPEQADEIKQIVGTGTQVLIYVADGLSSTAIEENASDVLKIMTDGLKSKGVKVASPFFVKYGRVGSMDSIGDIVDADVICVLIGERPGLVTAGSMSVYFAYKPVSGMPESRRTVISNIHKGGTPAVEAGAHLVDIVKKALDNKASGLDLKL